jgi:hypothetical protein
MGAQFRSVADAKPALDILSRALEEAGRSWADFGLGAYSLWRCNPTPGISASKSGVHRRNAHRVQYHGSRRAAPEHLDALRRFAEEMKPKFEGGA